MVEKAWQPLDGVAWGWGGGGVTVICMGRKAAPNLTTVTFGGIYFIVCSRLVKKSECYKVPLC